MVGPREELMLLMRAEIVVGCREVVRRDSRISVSENERSEMSIAGGCACVGEWSDSCEIEGIEGGRSSDSSDCRSDFNLKSLLRSTNQEFGYQHTF